MESEEIERPRLTTAIREFGGISRCFEPVESKNIVHNGQRLTWEQLQVIFRKNCQAKKNLQIIKQCSRSLIEEAGFIVGRDESVKVKRNAAVDLFIKFYDEDQLTQDVIKDIKSTFRTSEVRSIKQAFTIVQEILLTVNEQGVREINYAVKTDPKSKEFGRKLKLSMELPIFPSYDSYSDSDSENEGYDIVGKFREFHKDHMKKNNSDIPSSSKVPSKIVTDRNKEGLPWLRQQIATNFNSEDLVEPTLVLLKSNDSDEQLQMGLCELLGFDNIELVGEILRKRQSLLYDDKLVTSHGIREMSLHQERDMTSNYGCQVIVQTDAEKQVAKAIRKEEKKAKRLIAKNDNFDQFDPVLMREKRNRELALAASAPLFSQQYKTGAAKKEYFQNVYDSKLAAQQTPLFAGGMKMSLPEGCEIKSTKQFEEVKVPATRGYLEQPWPLVKISEMHKIAQLAFTGIKCLNTIQSCVYKTAYQTNENLLICAPTGAGKTNVAMLTIVKEIMRNVVSGVIQKDKFKIVYVAPMKALAAEMTENFGKRLSSLGIIVRELTGDMQLKKSEIMSTQMLITTPEKWDVVTRKSTGDEALSKLVRLLIIDEVHLLHDERGPVLETLVARTLRQVETQQTMIRIVGLSATLPNYTDVARFLRVNLQKGLFFFDGRFRPVPLQQTFVGVKAKNLMMQRRDMDEACYYAVVDNLRNDDQVLVFVHARNATIKTAEALLEIARENNETSLFSCQDKEEYTQAQKQMERSRNRELKELFRSGVGCHHAGMLRSDRTMVEKLFSKGLIKVLCCTATLAWGVNLPAHAVIIKGTQVYNAKQGAFVDLGILDVMQIFGRAGRPQFDTTGEGTIITTYDKLARYLSLMTRQNPIESQFVDCLVDNLNAEIALGTVNTVEDGVKWLSYTYLYTRIRRNPLVYGINHAVIEKDPDLVGWQHDLITLAGKNLDKTKMIRFDQRTGYFYSTDLGRTASHFYIKYKSIEVFNECIKAEMDIGAILSMISKSHEFEQVKVREDEMTELDNLLDEYCFVPLHSGPEDTEGKVNILLQTFISSGDVRGFSLISDLNYIAQNAARIIRGVFEIVLKKKMTRLTGRMLKLCKCVDKRLWPHNSPLRQFGARLKNDILRKIEDKRLTLDQLKEYSARDLGSLLRNPHAGDKVIKCLNEIPVVHLETSIQPITRTILRIKLTITPEFKWNNHVHGAVSEPFWIWVEDPDTDDMYHSEYIHVTKKQVVRQETQDLVFTIPLAEPHPSQYMVHMESDNWFGSSAVCPISFQHLILPERHPPHTELLDLDPLPVSAMQDTKFESVYSFTHFNPIQTQIFHCLYHNDCNALIGAPTGSGKTVAAELSIFRMLRTQPGCKAVYVAPLKALVRERIKDWKRRLGDKLGLKLVELTGDNAPDMRAVAQSDVIITTPEKWDGVSRSWHTRGYVQKVALLIIDEIHLLGQDRGPVLEVIVSRTNFISSQTERNVRIVGLSTALANARDLADWLNINQLGLFNFRPSVRPVPMEVHIQGFAGKHYCPRMASMNKPAFQAIRTHSQKKPALIFVSSRRQTRLTAFELMSLLAAEDNPKQWLHTDEMEMEELTHIVRDPNLRLTLAFGIGIHHAGLVEKDRCLVERLFADTKIQVLIATSTLAWGVNLPAHLVIVKGTEYFDGKHNRYCDFPITDVLQMMGRAGRPQFDDKAVAVILVHDVKKSFYKKFLYEPFPVESSLLEVLQDHLNAEVVAGTIANKQEALDYLTWTYFYRRLLMNPTYYELQDTDHDSVNKFLSKLLEKSILDLRESGCLCWEKEEGERELEATNAGRIASFYYLSHLTMRMLAEKMHGEMTIEETLVLLSDAQEYHELSVRHNEDGINSDLSRELPVRVDQNTFDSPHTKALLLMYAHLCRVSLPSTDYVTDLKSVLDQAIRVLQSFVDASADQGWIVTSLRSMHLIQMMSQACWFNETSLLSLPHVEKNNVHVFESMLYKGYKVEEINELVALYNDDSHLVSNNLHRIFNQNEVKKICTHISQLPQIKVELSVRGWFETNPNKQLEKSVPYNFDKSVRDSSTWVEVHSDQEYFISVQLKRINLKQMKNDDKALTPRFPKPKLEGWFLVLGDKEKRELVALKRVSTLRRRTTESVSFITPIQTGRMVLTLWLISDTYLGLDQIYDVRLDVINKLKSQDNENEEL